MSASEKLRTLGPPFDLTKTHSWIDARDDGQMREMNTMVALYDALPQIIAVVEAAQALHERVEMDESVGVCLSSRQESLSAGAALAALDEALS